MKRRREEHDGSGVLHGAQRFCFQGVDPVRLDTFRRLFALTFLIYLGAWSLHAREWLTDHGFHYTAETDLTVRADPAPLLPGFAVPLFVVALVASTVPLILGWKVRLFSWCALGIAVYAQLVDYLAEFSINKLYIVGFALLAVAPRIVEDRSADGPPVRLQSVWPVRVLQTTLVILYAVSGVCKTVHGDWFSDPDLLWRFVQGIYRTDVAALMLRNLPKVAWTMMMIPVIAFELLAPFLFLYRRTRSAAIIFGILLHLGIAVLFEGIVHFSAQMLTFYVLFIDASHLRELRGCADRGLRLLVRAPFRLACNSHRGPADAADTLVSSGLFEEPRP